MDASEPSVPCFSLNFSTNMVAARCSRVSKECSLVVDPCWGYGCKDSLFNNYSI